MRIQRQCGPTKATRPDDHLKVAPGISNTDLAFIIQWWSPMWKWTSITLIPQNQKKFTKSCVTAGSSNVADDLTFLFFKEFPCPRRASRQKRTLDTSLFFLGLGQ